MKICLSCEGVAATELDRCAHCDVPLLPTSAAHFPIRRGEADSTNPLLGSVIDGKFLIQGVLGRGGMGTVFRACHNVSLVPVALKLLHPRLSARTEYRRGLLAEARKAGRVVHDHCARVIDVGETEEGTVYLAMELADGEPLDAWVRGHGLVPAVAVDVLIQICRALVAIHRAGLVHRDLSSRNVMVAVRDGKPLVKVLDFGIAQSIRLAPVADDGGGAGEFAFANPVFSAPEHLAGQEVDARADLYSLGVLAFLLLSGRLPVDQHDARAAARATVAGRLLPLQPPVSVPRRLLRLVQSCLQLDREQRPASASAVLHELQALVSGRLRWLPRVSIAAFALCAVVAIATFARATVPFLRLAGGALPLTDGALQPDSAAHYLGTAALRQLRAHFGGFAAGRLEVEVSRGNTRQWRRQLQPVVESEGELVLSDLQAAWHDTLETIARASAQGPVDLSFVVPGVAVLGSVRVCIDDEPPVLSLRLHRGAGEGESGDHRLDASSVVHLECRDSGGIDSLLLRLQLQSGVVREFPLRADATEFALGRELARFFGPTAPLGPAQLELVGTDRARNRSALPPLSIDDCDFGVGSVLDVKGPAGETTILYLEDRARLRVRLSAVEPDLTVRVRDVDDNDRGTGDLARITGEWYELELRAAATGEPFASGLYKFQVRDPAGNRSDSTLPLAFRNSRLDVAFAPAGSAPVEFAGGEIVVGPGGAAFTMTCNPAFAPREAQVRPIGATPTPASTETGLRAQGTGWLVTVGTLPPGSYQLVFELEQVGEGRAMSIEDPHPLVVLPEQLVVRLPDARQHFLPPLLKANLFECTGEVLRQGGAVSVDAELRRFLRGRLWTGADPATLAPQPLLEPNARDQRLLPPSPLLRGRNVFALEVHDVLGRPVAVTVGDRPAPVLAQDQRQLALVADFLDDPTPPQPVPAELRVERDQSVRLRLRTSVPFTAEDRAALQLVIGSNELAAASVQRVESGAEVVFELPFAVWSSGAELGELPRADYAKGIAGLLDAQLETPAGRYGMQLALRTARTTLRVVRLDEVVERALDPQLAALQLVPVLAPDSGEWLDPVPQTAPGRGLYRQQPPTRVRGFGDFFVQDREFTLGQYAALLTALPRHGAAASGLWHADDPLGAERLAPAAMIPSAWRDDPAGFAAAVATQPDAALCGVDFFQAYTATRLLGVLVAADAGLFRLPLGCELELAAFGGAPAGDARNGASAQGGRVRAEPWREWLQQRPGPAGPTRTAVAAMGDLVSSSPFGRPIHGLDFGVREWVFDLPQGSDTGGEPLLRELIANRDRHIESALELAGGLPPPLDLRSRLPAALQARLRTFGVVRGLAVGEASGLLDVDGRQLSLLGLQFLPSSAPGVVRTEQLRRDGRDLMPDLFDPRLGRTGFRIVGDRAFVQRVRGR